MIYDKAVDCLAEACRFGEAAWRADTADQAELLLGLMADRLEAARQLLLQARIGVESYPPPRSH